MAQSDACLSQSIQTCTLRLRRERDGREFELDLESNSRLYHRQIAAFLNCDIVDNPKKTVTLRMIPLEALAPACVLFAAILAIGTATSFSPASIIQFSVLASLGFWSAISIGWIGLRLALRTRA